MSKKPETTFKERIRPHLEALPNAFWEKIQNRTVRGVPDFLGCVNGVFVALELKTDDGELDPLQTYKLWRIRECGGVAMTVTPSVWPQVLEELKLLAQSFKDTRRTVRQ